MGKKIDYFVLTAGITVGFYLYIRSAIGNRVLAIALSILYCAVVRRLFRRMHSRITGSSYARRRKLRKMTSGAMMHLAMMEDQLCQEKLCGLIGKIYDENCAVELIQRHPASGLQIGDIFTVWQKHKDEDKLLVVSTAYADSDCMSLSRELKQPKLAILDAAALSALIAEHPEGMFPETENKIRSGHRAGKIASALISRRNVPKCLAMFFSMMMIYIFSANVLYLAGALFLLLISLLSLRSRKRPAKLF